MFSLPYLGDIVAILTSRSRVTIFTGGLIFSTDKAIPYLQRAENIISNTIYDTLTFKGCNYYLKFSTLIQPATAFKDFKTKFNQVTLPPCNSKLY